SWWWCLLSARAGSWGERVECACPEDDTVSAARWRAAMNSGAGRLAWQRPATNTRFAAAGAAAGRAGTPVPGAGSGSGQPRWLGAITRYVAARHVLVLIALLFFPVVATPFFTYQIAAQSLILGTIALSLTFLGGYGG